MDMTIKEAYELICTNCAYAVLAGTTCEDFAKLDEAAQMELATWVADWSNGKFAR